MSLYGLLHDWFVISRPFKITLAKLWSKIVSTLVLELGFSVRVWSLWNENFLLGWKITDIVRFRLLCVDIVYPKHN